MNKNKVVYSLLVVIALLVLAIMALRNEPRRREELDRDPQTLTLTQHARCRMACRGIDRNEILEIIQKGAINFNKSNRRAQPCPTYAVQGRTSTGERIRVILAQCRTETRVITCYNLDQEFDCNCPGDEKKN